MTRVVVVSYELEEGLAAEVEAAERVVVPIRPPAGSGFRGEAAPVSVETWIAPQLSPGILVMALWTAAFHPARAGRAVALALGAARGPRGRIRALAAAIKGLWLANLARSWEADRVHATSARSAGAAGVAAHILAVPLTVDQPPASNDS